MPWSRRPLLPRRPARMATRRPSRVRPAQRGSSTASAAGILPICHRMRPGGSGKPPVAPRTAAVPAATGPLDRLLYGGVVDHDRQLAASPFPDDQGLADPAARRAMAAALTDRDVTAYLRA